jgi:hypothetical protein
MRVLNDFQCALGHTAERYLDNGITLTECIQCGGPARKLLRPIAFTLEGTSGDFPTAADKWVKKRNQKLQEELKQENP